MLLNATIRSCSSFIKVAAAIYSLLLIVYFFGGELSISNGIATALDSPIRTSGPSLFVWPGKQPASKLFDVCILGNAENIEMAHRMHMQWQHYASFWSIWNEKDYRTAASVDADSSDGEGVNVFVNLGRYGAEHFHASACEENCPWTVGIHRALQETRRLGYECEYYFTVRACIELACLCGAVTGHVCFPARFWWIAIETPSRVYVANCNTAPSELLNGFLRDLSRSHVHFVVQTFRYSSVRPLFVTLFRKRSHVFVSDA